MSDKQALAEMNADIATRVMREYKQSLRQPGPKLVMPGGRLVPASKLITGKLKNERMHSPLSISGKTAEKYFTPEWIAKHPGYEYAWVQVSDTPNKHHQAATAQARIGSGAYQVVPKDALRKDSGVACSTHTTPSGDKLLQIYDVGLVCMSPEVWGELFDAKTEMAARAVAGNYERFYDQVASTDPGIPGATGAHADLEVKLSR